MAQGDGPIVDPQKVQEILYGFLGAGMGVIAITELLKRRFKFEGLKSIILSVAVYVMGSACYLALISQFNFVDLAIYSTVVSFAANGIYLFPQSRKKNG